MPWISAPGRPAQGPEGPGSWRDEQGPLRSTGEDWPRATPASAASTVPQRGQWHTVRTPVAIRKPAASVHVGVTALLASPTPSAKPPAAGSTIEVRAIPASPALTRPRRATVTGGMCSPSVRRTASRVPGKAGVAGTRTRKQGRADRSVREPAPSVGADEGDSWQLPGGECCQAGQGRCGEGCAEGIRLVGCPPVHGQALDRAMGGRCSN